MNEYQKNNLEWIKACPEKMQRLKNGDWSDTISSNMKCVSCGRRNITTPIMKFFNWDGTKFLCYDCQNKL